MESGLGLAPRDRKESPKPNILDLGKGGGLISCVQYWSDF